MKRTHKAVLLLVVFATIYYVFFYPPRIKEIKIGTALETISELVAEGNPARIQNEATIYLSDNANIRFEIGYTQSVAEMVENNSKPAVVYEFNKPLFKSYLGNLLYSLSGYGFSGEIIDFSISPDWQSVDVVLRSVGVAEGQARFTAKLLPARFTYDAICITHILFPDGRPRIESLSCKMQLPKPEPLPQH